MHKVGWTQVRYEMSFIKVRLVREIIDRELGGSFKVTSVKISGFKCIITLVWFYFNLDLLFGVWQFTIT